MSKISLSNYSKNFLQGTWESVAVTEREQWVAPKLWYFLQYFCIIFCIQSLGYFLPRTRESISTINALDSSIRVENAAPVSINRSPSGMWYAIFNKKNTYSVNINDIRVFDVYLTYVNYKYTVIISSLPPQTQLFIPRFIKKLSIHKGKSYINYTTSRLQHGDLFKAKLFKDIASLYSFYDSRPEEEISRNQQVLIENKDTVLLEDTLFNGEKISWYDNQGIILTGRLAVYRVTRDQLLRSDLSRLYKATPVSYFIRKALVGNEILSAKIWTEYFQEHVALNYGYNVPKLINLIARSVLNKLYCTSYSVTLLINKLSAADISQEISLPYGKAFLYELPRDRVNSASFRALSVLYQTVYSIFLSNVEYSSSISYLFTSNIQTLITKEFLAAPSLGITVHSARSDMRNSSRLPVVNIFNALLYSKHTPMRLLTYKVNNYVNCTWNLKTSLYLTFNIYNSLQRLASVLTTGVSGQQPNLLTLLDRTRYSVNFKNINQTFFYTHYTTKHAWGLGAINVDMPIALTSELRLIIVLKFLSSWVWDSANHQRSLNNITTLSILFNRDTLNAKENLSILPEFLYNLPTSKLYVRYYFGIVQLSSHVLKNWSLPRYTVNNFNYFILDDLKSINLTDVSNHSVAVRPLDLNSNLSVDILGKDTDVADDVTSTTRFPDYYFKKFYRLDLLSSGDIL